MNSVQIPVRPHELHTRLVDAREAAFTLNLPLYYLTNATKRRAIALPHYRVGKLIRFKLDELATWQQRAATGKGTFVTGAPSGGPHAGL